MKFACNKPMTQQVSSLTSCRRSKITSDAAPAMSRSYPWLLVISSILMLFATNRVVFANRNVFSTAFGVLDKMRNNQNNADATSSDTPPTCPFDVDITLKHKHKEEEQHNDDSHTEQTRGHVCVSKLFRYHGGNCDSLNPNVVCKDFQGSNAHRRNGESFIVIRDPVSNETLFQQWVAVGGFFKISVPDGFRHDVHNVTMYSSEEKTVETMLQSLLINAPCESLGPSEAFSVSGGIQLMATAMKEANNVVWPTHQYEITIDGGALRDAMTLTDLILTSNVDGIGWLNLSADVAGKALLPGTNRTVTLYWKPEENGAVNKLDDDRESSHAFLVTATAEKESGETCILNKVIYVDNSN